MTFVPPPEYDVPPSIPVIEKIMNLDEVSALCAAKMNRALLPGQWIQGCTRVVNGTCYIWRIDDKITQRHEMAHCAGWPYNHPPYYRY